LALLHFPAYANNTRAKRDIHELWQNLQYRTLYPSRWTRHTNHCLFKGCPLHCQWCSNPESQLADKELSIIAENCTKCGRCIDVCTSHALSLESDSIVLDRERCNACGACVEVCRTEALEAWGKDISTEELLSKIKRDKPFYDKSGGGVTFSGGEVLAQVEFLVDMLQACKKEGIATAIQTSCYAATQSLDPVIQHTDLIIADIKHMDGILHQRLTGVSNERILHNIRYIAKKHSALVVQLPLIPGINDTEENIAQEIRFISSLPYILGVSLIAYHQLGIQKYKRLAESTSYLTYNLLTKNTWKQRKKSFTTQACPLLHLMGRDCIE